MVPRLLRAARITGNLNLAMRSSTNCFGLMGTSTPPTPSITSQSLIKLVGKLMRDKSISTPAQRAARSGETGGTFERAGLNGLPIDGVERSAQERGERGLAHASVGAGDEEVMPHWCNTL